jgi:hypothetical protein
MTDLVEASPRIPTLSPSALDQVYALEAAARARPQVRLVTHHVLHGGLYARTIRVPAGMLLTGALVKVATLLVIDGDALLHLGDAGAVRLTGRHVIPASGGRKQALVTLADTEMTMLLPTRARTVEEVEGEFTDEPDILMSRHDPDTNVIVITGE